MVMIVGATLILAFVDDSGSLSVEPDDVRNTQLAILCAVLASIGFATGSFLIKVFYTKYEQTPGFDFYHLYYDSDLLFGMVLMSVYFYFDLQFS